MSQKAKPSREKRWPPGTHDPAGAVKLPRDRHHPPAVALRCDPALRPEQACRPLRLMRAAEPTPSAKALTEPARAGSDAEAGGARTPHTRIRASRLADATP